MRHPHIVFSLLVISLIAYPSMGQLTSGSIAGRVIDSSGSVIPSADITVTNMTTGTILRAHANGQGEYVISGIDPGTYQIQVTREGFQSWEEKNLNITVGQPAIVNPSLQVGSITQSVEVQAAASSVDVQSPTISTPIETHTTQQHFR